VKGEWLAGVSFVGISLPVVGINCNSSHCCGCASKCLCVLGCFASLCFKLE
jgi:hypothetical protein